MHMALRKSPATTAHRPHCIPVALPRLDKDPPLVRRRVRVPREPPSRAWDASFFPFFFLLNRPLSFLFPFPPTVSPFTERIDDASGAARSVPQSSLSPDDRVTTIFHFLVLFLLHRSDTAYILPEIAASQYPRAPGRSIPSRFRAASRHITLLKVYKAWQLSHENA